MGNTVTYEMEEEKITITGEPMKIKWTLHQWSDSERMRLQLLWQTATTLKELYETWQKEYNYANCKKTFYRQALRICGKRDPFVKKILQKQSALHCVETRGDAYKERRRQEAKEGKLFGGQKCISTPSARAKISTSLKETYRKDRIRIKWGLPQKVKRKLIRNDRKNRMRNRLRNKHYTIDYGSNDVFYDSAVKRNPRQEERAKKMGLRFWEMMIE